jgi:hypothetical protein
MSLESARNLDIGSWDYDAIQDHEISADPLSSNPFTEGEDLDVTPRDYTVYAVPEGGQWLADNILGVPSDDGIVPSDGSASIWLRIVLPNKQVELKDLPEINARDIDTGALKECSNAPSASFAESTDEPVFFDLPGTFPLEGFEIPGSFLSFDGLFEGLNLGSVYDLESFDINDTLLGLLEDAVKEKWWIFKFRCIDIPFEGSSSIPCYSYGFTKITPGKVALVRFKAPSFVDTSPGMSTFSSINKDLRYWSLYVLDLAKGEGLVSFPDYLAQTDTLGFATFVYGPQGGAVETKAKELGYNFFPDLRPATQEEADKVMTFGLRQMLPSPSFAATGLHQGDYVPRARVCSADEFLSDLCRIEACSLNDYLFGSCNIGGCSLYDLLMGSCDYKLVFPFTPG